MKIKPRPDLPKPILNALLHDDYSTELSNHYGSLTVEFKKEYQFSISVTTLPRSPRSRVLSLRHQDELEIDPLSKYFALRGKLIHTILEKHAEPGDVVEKRIGVIVRDIPYQGELVNVYLNGQPDRYVPSEKLVQDWKDVKANAIMKGEKFEFHAQLSINAYLLRENGYEVERAQNIFLVKDFHGGRAHPGNNYPREPVVVAEVPLWSTEKIISYIRERIEAHINADATPDDDLPNCTGPEKWQSMPEYKVYKLKDDGSRMDKAKFASNSKLEAEEKAQELESDDRMKIIEKNNSKKSPKDEAVLSFPSYTVREIPSVPMKCLHYCDGKNWCSQFAQDVAKGYVKVEQEPEDEQE